MNSKLFQPFSACAQHVRSRFLLGCLFWPLGMAMMLSLAFPITSQAVSLASLSGTVYVDVNNAGSLQPGDPAVPGTLIQLFKDGDMTSPFAETYTNKRGMYSFADLPSGTYAVKNAAPSAAGCYSDSGMIYDVNAYEDILGNLGTDNSATATISGIKLDPGFSAYSYNFGNDEFPIQLYSKYYLIAGSYIPNAEVKIVPEPSVIVSLLMFAGLAGAFAIGRSRRTAG